MSDENNTLTHLNIRKDSTAIDGGWRLDLYSLEGDSWTIERGLTKRKAIERAMEFHTFSGLRITFDTDNGQTTLLSS